MKSLNKIHIVGSGTTGLMAATYLKTKKPDLQIEVFSDPTISPLLVGESSQPYISQYFDTVFENDDEWMDSCNATYKFYVKHNNWNSLNHTWIFPLCDERTDEINFNDISLSECESEVLNYTKDNLPPRQRIAWHMQSTALQPLMKLKCEQLFIPIYYEKYEFDEDVFVIDCRGFHGQTTQDSVSPAIINDYAIASHVSYQDIRYYTQTIAHEVGWRWEIPLQTSLGVGRVFSTKHLSVKDAISEMNFLYGEQEWYQVPFSSRYDKQPCSEDFLKLGSSAIFIEPLESTTLMLVTFMIDTFFRMGESWNWNIDKDFTHYYNEGFNKMVNGQVTYIEGFYCISERKDSNYWEEVTSNYNWYKNKIQEKGWPEYFGKYGFEKFFGSFDKLETFKELIDGHN